MRTSIAGYRDTTHFGRSHYFGQRQKGKASVRRIDALFDAPSDSRQSLAYGKAPVSIGLEVILLKYYDPPPIVTPGRGKHAITIG